MNRSTSPPTCHMTEVTAQAPGRVNLLGEHTDYNDGFVLPTAIPQCTTVHARRSNDDAHCFSSLDLAETVQVPLHGPVPSNFAAYPFGCILALRDAGVDVPPVALQFHSQVPLGSGLSSSAAMEVATLRALRKLLALDPQQFDDVQIALLAQQAENRYVGVPCGIMDQMASSLAHEGTLLFLDTRSLERRILPMPADSDIVVIHSGQPRTLAGSAYHERRAQCMKAASLLGLTSLRDIRSTQEVETLANPLLKRRALHVVTENGRVLEASQESVDKHLFGDLMNRSHASLRDDYQVSTSQLDLLVGLLQANAHVLGARLTGAGFGGACVALVHKGSAALVAKETLDAYELHGFKGQALVP